MFKKGDLVIAKPEFLDPKETLLDTAGIVVEYNPDNDYLGVGVLNPEEYALPPVFSGRGSCYEVVPPESSLAYEIECYELKKKQNKLQKVLSKKQDELNVVNQQIREVENRKSLMELHKGGIKKDACFVGFSKTLDYHCLLVSLIKVKSVSKSWIDCLGGNYRVDDGEYSYLVSKHSYTKSSFETLSERYELFAISNEAYAEINKILSGLEVTAENVEDLKATIKKFN